MTKNSKSKSVTIVGGKNVAPGAAPPQKTPKEKTTEPESPQTDTPDTPKEPTK